MYSARLIGFTEFLTMNSAWNSLVQEMPFPSFFCSWEWIYTWWERFGEGYEPIIVGVFDQERLLGVLPLASRERFFHHKWQTGRVLEFCGKEVASDHLDLVAHTGNAEECGEAIRSFFKRYYRKWDLLSFSHFSSLTNVHQLILTGNCQCIDGPIIFSKAPFLSINGTFRDYEKNVLRERGEGIRRKKRRLEEKGMNYISSVERDDGMDILFDLHNRRARAKDMESSFNGTLIHDFHFALAKRIKDKNWLYLRFLGDGERYIAAFYGFIFNKRLFYYQIGHDPEYDRLSPGAVLMYRVIEEAFALGLDEVDFLRGGESYKSIWASDHRDLMTATVYNKTLKGCLSRSAYRSYELAKGISGRM